MLQETVYCFANTESCAVFKAMFGQGQVVGHTLFKKSKIGLIEIFGKIDDLLEGQPGQPGQPIGFRLPTSAFRLSSLVFMLGRFEFLCSREHSHQAPRVVN